MTNSQALPNGDGGPEVRGRRLERLRRILERKIVPSLVIDPAVITLAGEMSAAQEDQADAMMAMALQGREMEAREDLTALARAGASFAQLQLGLLAPAADRLGKLWESDTLSYVDVTIATGTLQRLMQFVALDLHAPPLITSARSICLFPEPDATHIFGASMAARFFEFAGWQVHFVPDGNRERLRKIVSSQEIDVLGLSLAREDQAACANQLLDDLRRISRNRDILSIAGGGAFARAPHLVAETAADAVVAVIRAAPQELDQILLDRGE